MTPLDARSERTIFCTPTDSPTWKWSKPMSWRWLVRGVKRLAKHFVTDSSSMASPCTLR